MIRIWLLSLMACGCLALGNQQTSGNGAESLCFECHFDPDSSKANSTAANNPAQPGYPKCAMNATLDLSQIDKWACKYGKCFIRRDSNGLVYRGCADPAKLPWLVDSSKNCQYQGQEPSLYWFCEGSLCNGKNLNDVCAKSPSAPAGPPAGSYPGGYGAHSTPAPTGSQGGNYPSGHGYYPPLAPAGPHDGSYSNTKGANPPTAPAGPQGGSFVKGRGHGPEIQVTIYTDVDVDDTKSWNQPGKGQNSQPNNANGNGVKAGGNAWNNANSGSSESGNNNVKSGYNQPSSGQNVGSGLPASGGDTDGKSWYDEPQYPSKSWQQPNQQNQNTQQKSWQPVQPVPQQKSWQPVQPVPQQKSWQPVQPVPQQKSWQPVLPVPQQKSWQPVQPVKPQKSWQPVQPAQKDPWQATPSAQPPQNPWQQKPVQQDPWQGTQTMQAPPKQNQQPAPQNKPPSQTYSRVLNGKPQAPVPAVQPPNQPANAQPYNNAPSQPLPVNQPTYNKAIVHVDYVHGVNAGGSGPSGSNQFDVVYPGVDPEYLSGYNNYQYVDYDQGNNQANQNKNGNVGAANGNGYPSNGVGSGAQSVPTLLSNPCDGQCKDNPSGLFPHPLHADWYIQCGGGDDYGQACQCCKPYYLQCAKGVAFDATTHVCSAPLQ